MGCSFRWTTVCLTILSVWDGAVLCQNNTPGGRKISYQVENTSKEPSLGNNVSSKSQLMNTLLTVAAANGVLPDLLPVIQPTLSNDIPKYPQSKTDTPKTLNLIELSPNQYQRPQEPIVATVKPCSSPNQPSQPVVATPVPVSSHQSYMPLLQTTFTPRLTQSQVCPVSQAVRLPPSTYPSAGIVQPIPVTWQPQSVANVSPELWQPQLNSNEISREIRPLSTNLHITPPTYLIENDNAIKIEETPAARLPCIQIANDAFENSQSLPVNLQINLPAQNIPTPQITVVSAAPVSPRTSPEPIRPQNSFPPFFHPPIVVERSDSLNHWLPIMLVALFANDRDNCGGGCGCNCCCPCSNSNSKNVIPIPYPIPFPVNNAIINNSGHSKTKSHKSRQFDKSCKNEDESDGDHH